MTHFDDAGSDFQIVALLCSGKALRFLVTLFVLPLGFLPASAKAQPIGERSAVEVQESNGRRFEGTRRSDSRGQGRRGEMRKAMDEMDLKPEQRAKIKAAFQGERDALKDSREQLNQARKDLEDAIQSDPFKEGEVRNAARRLAKIQEELAVQRARTAAKMRENLTPEQRSKFQDYRGKMQQRLDERRKRGRRDSARDDRAPANEKGEREIQQGEGSRF